MKILLKTLYAGPAGVIHPGLRDLPDDTAQQLISAGAAIPVNIFVEMKLKPEPGDVETASVAPQQKAVARSHKKKR